MFDGAPADQFHQFIAARTTLPLHFPSSLHASPTPNTFPPPFDPYNPSHHHHQLPLQPNLFHPLHHKDDEQEKEANSTVSSINFETERDQTQLPNDDELIDSWTNDEVLALLKIRSSMESWFPELTWDHVSRKLAELGFKKSAEKCKEKFEDESRYFNNNINYAKNYRFLSELEELCQGDHNNQNPADDHVVTEKTHHQSENPSEGGGGGDMMGRALEEDSISKSASKQCEGSDKNVEKSMREEKKRKRKRRGIRFEMFKGFCESIVNKMMAHQEEIHNKLLEDMMKRDGEKFAREEAWKKQEMERMNKELEVMAQEQAIAGDRQATFIEFLKKCAAASSHNFGDGNGKLINKITTQYPNQNGSSTSSPLPPILHSQNPKPSTGESNLEPVRPPSNVILNHQIQSTCFSPPSQNNPGLLPVAIITAENLSSSDRILQVPSSSSNSSTPAPNNPSPSLNSQPLESNSASTFKPSLTIDQKDDVGRRWPRDEVLALINLRCTSLKNSSSEEIKEGNNNKAPLWERISQGMSELGYNRSAKRCKEKWENINKYFRKTKDVNKKRSIDSRTCPYFHQLRNLYSQGKLAPQISETDERQENQLNTIPTANSGQLLPQDQAQLAESPQVGSGGFTVHDDHGGQETLIPAPHSNFDYF